MYGEDIMLIHRGWTKHTDVLRDVIWTQYPEIHIKDIQFMDINAFNQCERNNNILIGFSKWENVHPLFRIVPVEWEYTVPFGILHAPEPSALVTEFLDAVAKVYDL